MQQETAELHKRFLEGQEMAQRALLAAIGGQAIPPMPPMGRPQGAQMPPIERPPMPPIPSMPMPPLGVHGVPPIPPMPSIPVEGPIFYQSNVPPVQPKEQIQQNNAGLPRSLSTARNDDNTKSTKTITTTTTTKTVSVDADKLRETLIDVVAEKTGYPKEMLNLDMDMEAELGIDSIKRVEIMSAIQERLPDAPVVQPDQLGKLRTLNQILEVITPQNNAGLPRLSARNDGQNESTNTITTTTTTKTASISSEKLRNTLIEVVSEKTGYPADMLNLDMDMEAELGIDSIKRVEIMSAIQERLPDAPVVQPDQLGKLRTLNQILEVITPATKISQSANADIPLYERGSNTDSTHSSNITSSNGISSSDTPLVKGGLRGVLDSNKLKSTLIEVVSEKTGYPQDMLNLDMDMEAELGIDSIKRVEIMSAIQERLPDAP
ncbi:MAG: hypothetical protein J6Z11_00235, partial [Candidatus Riflebacteria bacterium]|nr:hypothetical protein [Candidatus Riflebacteria bacterium]